ncbi:unnamed protein product, partial [Mesorhabditis belari]|uniref:RRM domain-containing protein n=1 Tax=Mesorhabditis belari TaxID=2138241 RepID=A0AAF3FNR1_9BILA
MPLNNQIKASKSGNELFKSDTQYTCQMQKMSELVSTIDVKDDDISGGSIEYDEFSENRLFISNFPFEWTEKELREFLKDYGPVESVEIVYNERGSKGFGFATINDAERCLKARRTLNHTIANGRRVEVRRAHKHKRATNTGPPPGQKQNTAEMLQQIQNLNALLMAQFQLSQLQQPMALAQAALAQPAILTLLQSQLAGNALAGLGNSCADLSSFSNPALVPTMASPSFVQPQSQTQTPVGSGREAFKASMRSKVGRENVQQEAPTSGVDGFTQNIWDYSPRQRIEVNSTPRTYRLFNTPKIGLRRAFGNEPIVASTQTIGYDDEGHIEIGQIPLCTSTPFHQGFRHEFPHDRSFSMPDMHKLGHE